MDYDYLRGYVDSSDLKKRIKDAEQAREKGNSRLALKYLEGVIRLSPRDNHELISEALQHRIICYKHLYQNHELVKEACVDGMEEDLSHAFQLDLPIQQKAVFYLRRGDLEKLRGDFKNSERSYQIAFDLVNNNQSESNFTRAEYLGHLVEAKTINGDYKDALHSINYALWLMSKDTTARPFHRRIILAGLHARRITPAFRRKLYAQAVSSTIQCLYLAVYLKYIDHMPQRYNQLKQQFRKSILG